MIQALIQKTRENIKPSYQFKNMTYYVHGLTLNGVEYEYHSKTNNCRYNANSTIWYESVTVDKQGNQKLKGVTDKDPNGGQAPSTQQNMSQGGQQLIATGISLPNVKNALWLQVFSALCTLKSGTSTKAEEIVQVTDHIVATKLP